MDVEFRHLPIGHTFDFIGGTYEVMELDPRYKKNLCAGCDIKVYCRLGIARIGVNVPLCSIRKDKKMVVFKAQDKHIVKGAE